jgi:hypothetical protein
MHTRVLNADASLCIEGREFGPEYYTIHDGKLWFVQDEGTEVECPSLEFFIALRSIIKATEAGG